MPRSALSRDMPQGWLGGVRSLARRWRSAGRDRHAYRPRVSGRRPVPGRRSSLRVQGGQFVGRPKSPGSACRRTADSARLSSRRAVNGLDPAPLDHLLSRRRRTSTRGERPHPERLARSRRGGGSTRGRRSPAGVCGGDRRVEQRLDVGRPACRIWLPGGHGVGDRCAAGEPGAACHRQGRKVPVPPEEAAWIYAEATRRAAARSFDVTIDTSGTRHADLDQLWSRLA